MVGSKRPIGKKRKTQLNMAVYKIFGPKSYLEQMDSKNDLNCETFSDMKQEERDIKIKPIIKKQPKNDKKDQETIVTESDLSKHNSKEDAWICLYGKVYDMTKYISMHPGGNIILQAAGKDGTELFGKTLY